MRDIMKYNVAELVRHGNMKIEITEVDRYLSTGCAVVEIRPNGRSGFVRMPFRSSSSFREDWLEQFAHSSTVSCIIISDAYQNIATAIQSLFPCVDGRDITIYVVMQNQFRNFQCAELK